MAWEDRLFRRQKARDGRKAVIWGMQGANMAVGMRRRTAILARHLLPAWVL